MIEPTRDDMRMFSYNIMRYSARRVVARYGYRSALQSFRQNHARYGRVLARHGIRLRDPFELADTPARETCHSPLARNLSTSLDALESSLRRV